MLLEGRKETLSQQWSLFSLCIVKQSVALVCGSAEGFFFFATLNEHLSMATGEEPWSTGHFRLGWVGSFESLAQGSNA